MLELDNLNSFKKWLDSPPLQPAAIQDLYLNGFKREILASEFQSSIFMGCVLDTHLASHIVKTGGIIIPDIGGFKFKSHRANLYSPEELFAGFSLDASYQDSFDYKVYEEYIATGKSTPTSIKTSLARRLHDHSITDALEEAILDRKVIAIMGGHSMERNEKDYFRIARIARDLSQSGFLIVSGGGPGAMEASHLGAYFAHKTLAELEQAIEILAPRPAGAIKGKEYKDKDWLHRAWRVKDKFPNNNSELLSIGIPTWLYGHEPPTIFATKIAKYFANSVREDGLVSIAKYGIIFAPGSAGTVQEIFQDHTQNFYGSLSHYSPMILLDSEFWSKELPIKPLLSKMSKGRKYAELLYISDNEKEIVDYIKNYNPDEYKT